MIDKDALRGVVENALQGSGLLLAGLRVSSDNVIEIDLDKMDGDVSIDDCQRVNDAVLAAFDRDVEDYELTVGSVGLTAPFTHPRQYEKYRGGEVEVLTADGRKLKGVLADSNDTQFTIEVEQKVKDEGSKRPRMAKVPITLPYAEVKYTKNIIKF